MKLKPAAPSNLVFNGRVIFDHLPKTAGQAICNWLQTIFGPAIVTDNLIGDHRELIQRYGGRFSVISGHIAFEGDGLDPRYGYMTCFREPIDRAISWLFFVIKNHEASQHPELWEMVHDFITSEGDQMHPELLGYIENPYVKHFSSIVSVCPKSDAEKLEDAFSAIHHYDVIGIYEHLDLFLQDVANFLGIHNPPSLLPVNVTVARPRANDISDKLKQRLISLNQLDIAFYQTLKQQYELNHQPHDIGSASTAALLWAPYNRANATLLSISETTTSSKKSHLHQQTTLSCQFTLSALVPQLDIKAYIYDQHHHLILTISSLSLEQSLYQLVAGYYQMQVTIGHQLPAGRYQITLSFIEHHLKGLRELGLIHSPFEIAEHAPNSQLSRHTSSKTNAKSKKKLLAKNLYALGINLEYINDSVAKPIESAQGDIQCEILPQTAPADTQFELPITVVNRSAHDWITSLASPINLSYHWLNAQGAFDIFEGLRTALPCTCLYAGQSIPMQMQIETPKQAGIYSLTLLPVQEGLAWFDSLGFTPLTFQIQVM